MSNTKTTKRALLTSVMALMLCFAMLTGTTFAWFTDTETSSGNKIVAGNLDVELLLWDGVSTTDYTNISDESKAIFTADGANLVANDSLNTIWEPGKTQVAYLAIKNEGNLDLKYMVNLDTRNPADGKDLYKAMQYTIIPDAQFGKMADGTDVEWVAADALSVTPGIFAVSESTELAVGATHYFALAIHMMEEAGNEYQGGKVEFDINVLATQLNAEEDAFGPDYDKNANFDNYGFGVATVDGRSSYEIRVEDKVLSTAGSSTKIGQASIPAAAVADDATELKVTIEKKADVYDEVTVESDQGATTYDVTVEGIKENNDADVKITIKVGTGLTGVKVYHKGQLITSNYDDAEGEVTFNSKTFSPFTVVYDAVAKEVEKEEPTESNRPEADISVKADYVQNADIQWNGATEGLEAMLDAAFIYGLTESVEDAQAGPYADWYCDFYVSLNRDLLPNQMFLAGSYGGYHNIGFHVTADMLADVGGTLEAGTEVPLLAVAIGQDINAEWTYGAVASLVGEFICGVGDVDGALDGATFTVELRLTNPENTNDHFSVATVDYTFDTDGAGTTVYR